MRAQLLLQPFHEDGRVGAVLAERANSATSLRILTAWAQESGLKYLRPIVDAIRTRKGYAEAILGVDQGIATLEGLQQALQLFDAVYLFHDGERTFHPKLYLIENDRLARLVIGSSNATEGGFYTNFEASVALDLNRRTPSDARLRKEAHEYYKSFIASGMPFRRLDNALLKELRDEKLIPTSAERRRADRQRRKQTEPSLKKLFGGRVTGLPGAPPLPGPARRQPASRRRTSRAGTLAPGPPPVTTSPVVMSWWRELSTSDAMKKPTTSHQRRNVILNRGRHPIDQTTFFRQHFFQGTAWSQQTMRSFRGRPPGTKEVAVVPFDVRIGRRRLGTHNLTVDHADSRIAGQGNSPTWLNWSSLANEIAKGNYVGRYLLLEHLANGSFRLTLTRSQPGPAHVPSAARVVST